jgi:hypothetical protein
MWRGFLFTQADLLKPPSSAAGTLPGAGFTTVDKGLKQ